MHHKRLRVEASSLPRTVISAAVATNSTVPSTPPAVASPQGGLVPLPAVAERGNKPEDKVQANLERHGKSFCEELGVSFRIKLTVEMPFRKITRRGGDPRY